MLEDGRIFRGTSYGATGTALGEAVFATGMTGYQETITDPSYARQLVVQTAPHIGNTGVNTDDAESRRIWVAGYIVRDAARRPSNWRSERSLDDELVEQGDRRHPGRRHPRHHPPPARTQDHARRHLLRRRRPRHGQGTRRRRPGQRADGRLTARRGSQRGRGLHRGAQGLRLGRRAAVQHRRDRPRHQAHDPDPLRRARRPGARAARHGHPRRRPGRQPRRLLHVQRPRRPRHRGQPGEAAALRARREDPVLRHLLRQPDPGPRPRASAPTSSATATAASTSP